ncbi:hypothetical protein FACS1894109_12560 [Spirochaetia bacterium]|nr:hypothetical protein FACS1894109_12560 [Spirochaetia bacterium]
MNEEVLAEKIMALFRKNNCQAGDTISPQLYLAFLWGLNPSEQNLATEAINWLEEIQRSYITVKNEAAYPNITLRLTPAGYDHIYGNTGARV